MPRYQWLAMWAGAVLFPAACAAAAYALTGAVYDALLDRADRKREAASLAVHAAIDDAWRFL